MTFTLPRWRPSRRGVYAATVAAVTGVLVLVCYALGLLNNLERQSVDERFSWRGAQPPGSEIVVVAIDWTTKDDLGIQPPLPRPYFADVLATYVKGHPR